MIEATVTAAMANGQDVTAVAALYQSFTIKNRGRIIFLTGPLFSGRSTTLHAIGKSLANEYPPPAILFGSCSTGVYTPLEVSFENAATLTGEVLALAAKVIVKTAPGTSELADLAAQLLQTALATKPMMDTSNTHGFSPQGFKETLRRCVAVKPIVLLIDDIDRAYDQRLLDLLREMAVEIDKMPLLVVATIQSDVPLEASGELLPERAIPDIIKRVKGLVDRGISELKPVTPLTQSQIENWIGSAQPGIIPHLYGITGGYAKCVFRLLCDWEERNVVYQDGTTGRWLWTTNSRPPVNIVNDVIGARLARLCPSMEQVEEVKTWLAYGAMEGNTFTASAVAKAAQYDEDELIDVIDDILLWDSKSNPNGLLLDAKPVVFVSGRTLWRYTFADTFYCKALISEGFTRNELSDARNSLIKALLETYEQDQVYIAASLARLYRESGSLENAQYFQDIADFRVPKERVREYALYLASLNKDGWTYWDQAQSARFLNTAAGEMRYLFSYEETLVVAEEAYRLSQKIEAIEELGTASLYCGYLFHKQGDFLNAEERLKQAHDIALKSASPHLEGASIAGLGGLYHTQGKHEKAEPLFERALAICEKALGAEHPDTAKSLNNLAFLYNSQGRYEKAEPLFERALAIYEKVLGAEDPVTAGSLNNLAFLYNSQGRYEKAEPLFERALVISEKVPGAENAYTATILNSLAGLYHTQGKYEKAEPLLERALAIKEKVLGPEHPDTATSLNNLAELYKAQGKYEKAEPLFERALAISEKALGAEHPHTVTSLNNLAGLYCLQGRYEKAEPLYERALAISLNTLAEFYRAQGKYEKAEPLLEQALAIREKVLGPEHPDTATSLNNLAELYKAQGKYEKAEPLLERALAIRAKVLGPEHPDTATSLNNLAELYKAQGKYEKAEPLLERALATSLNNLAELYRAQASYEKAEPLLERALAIMEKALGPEHLDTAGSLTNLAGLYCSQGRYEKAEPLMRRGIQILLRASGEMEQLHPYIKTALERYYEILIANGQDEEAAMETMSRVFALE